MRPVTQRTRRINDRENGPVTLAPSTDIPRQFYGLWLTWRKKKREKEIISTTRKTEQSMGIFFFFVGQGETIIISGNNYPKGNHPVREGWRGFKDTVKKKILDDFDVRFVKKRISVEEDACVINRRSAISMRNRVNVCKCSWQVCKSLNFWLNWSNITKSFANKKILSKGMKERRERKGKRNPTRSSLQRLLLTLGRDFGYNWETSNLQFSTAAIKKRIGQIFIAVDRYDVSFQELESLRKLFRGDGGGGGKNIFIVENGRIINGR